MVRIKESDSYSFASMTNMLNQNGNNELLLITPVTKKEAYQALKGIDDLKALGCDGFNAHFFKKAWAVIGDETTEIVTHFFSTGILYKPINCTTVTRIPKVPNPPECTT